MDLKKSTDVSKKSTEGYGDLWYTALSGSLSDCALRKDARTRADIFLAFRR
jgi:hypothetical protein